MNCSRDCFESKWLRAVIASNRKVTKIQIIEGNIERDKIVVNTKEELNITYLAMAACSVV